MVTHVTEILGFSQESQATKNSEGLNRNPCRLFPLQWPIAERSPWILLVNKINYSQAFTIPRDNKVTNDE